MRAKVLVLGFTYVSFEILEVTTILTSRLPRRVTARRITPHGPPPPSELFLEGLSVGTARLSLSSLISDNRKSRVPKLMLSLRALAFCRGAK
jgi:hypothetical protein